MVSRILANSFQNLAKGHFGRIDQGHDSQATHRRRESLSLSLRHRSAELSRRDGVDDGDSLQISSAANLSLKVRNKTRVRVNEDGSTRAVSKTRLNFKYELETADGQRLQLKARARIKQSIVQDENGDIAVKTKVKLQFKLLQEDVAGGLSSLTENLGDDQANPLDAFLNVVEGVVADFTDDGTVDADTLINTVLEGFNSLLDAFGGDDSASGQQVFGLPTPDQNVVDALPNPLPVSDGAGEVFGLPTPVPSDDVEVVPVAIDVEPIAEDNGTEDNGAGEVFGLPTPDASAEDQAEPVEIQLEPVVPVAQAEVAEVETDDVDDADEVDGDDDDDVEATASTQPTAESAAQPEDNVVEVKPPVVDNTAARQDQIESAQEVLQTVRLKFVQSFSQVVSTLSPEGEDDGGLLLVQRGSYRLSAKAHLSYAKPSVSNTEFLA